MNARVPSTTTCSVAPQPGAGSSTSDARPSSESRSNATRSMRALAKRSTITVPSPPFTKYREGGGLPQVDPNVLTMARPLSRKRPEPGAKAHGARSCGMGASLAAHAVVIAGGGPTGLMLAGELALAGVDVVIVERRVNQDVDGSRAGGLLSRTIEVLDQRGIAERFLAAGYIVPAQGFAGIVLDISDFPTRHNYVLALWQSQFEPILADWVVRARGSDPSWPRGGGLRARTTPASMSRCPTTRRSERSTSSAATEGAAWSARPPASTSPGWTLDQLDDRRGRDGRGAGVRLPSRQRRPARDRSTGTRRADPARPHRTRPSTTPANPAWTSSARRSSACTERTSGFAAPTGSRGSPT